MRTWRTSDRGQVKTRGGAVSFYAPKTKQQGLEKGFGKARGASKAETSTYKKKLLKGKRAGGNDGDASWSETKMPNIIDVSTAKKRKKINSSAQRRSERAK